MLCFITWPKEKQLDLQKVLHHIAWQCDVRLPICWQCGTRWRRRANLQPPRNVVPLVVDGQKILTDVQGVNVCYLIMKRIIEISINLLFLQNSKWLVDNLMYKPKMYLLLRVFIKKLFMYEVKWFAICYNYLRKNLNAMLWRVQIIRLLCLHWDHINTEFYHI